MIIKNTIFKLLIDQSITEEVALGYKNNPEKISVRVNSTNEGKEKPHAADVKVFIDNTRDDFLIALNKDFTVNQKSTKTALNKNRNALVHRNFTEYHKFVAGAIYYSRKEMKEFIEHEYDFDSKYQENLQNKFDEYYKLDKKDQRYYQRKAFEGE